MIIFFKLRIRRKKLTRDVFENYFSMSKRRKKIFYTSTLEKDYASREKKKRIIPFSDC